METEEGDPPVSLPTTVILQGIVKRMPPPRTGTAEKTGKPYSIQTCVIFGDHTYGEVTLADDIRPALGATVTLLCEVGVYNTDDQLRAVEWLDRPQK